MSTSGEDPEGREIRAQKLAVARAALELVTPGEILGVGTGSTANRFIDVLAEEMEGRIPATVASSEETARRLRDRGFEVRELNDVDDLRLYVDGADEFEPGLALLKGGGGALTREKILAQAARRFVCIVDASKRVGLLGGFPLAVEVIPMARTLVTRKLRELGGEPRRRQGFRTDNGNEIVDVHGLEIRDPVALEEEIDAYPGVVTCGIFARRRADLVLMATPGGVRRFGEPTTP